MSRSHHGVRILALMAAVAALLVWKAAHAPILFADGLRYVKQARALDQGAWNEALLRSVDHPVYPVAIAASHRAFGTETSPESWQAAGQFAAVLAGLLLVIPVYLVALELFGPRIAWLAVLFSFGVPLASQVFADVLSESTFLLFWMWGLWCSLRFLREGEFVWLPATLAFSVLAYLTRPEGLLLPAAFVATLGLMPLLRSTRLNWPQWWRAVGFLALGFVAVVGPYVASKGGIGTKPGIARVLGLAPKSSALAVERARPLNADETALETYAHAAKALVGAVRDGLTWPLIPLVAVGAAFGWRGRIQARTRVFLGIILVASALALIRLHATGGYCTPRHALIPLLILYAFAAFGLDIILDRAQIPARWLALGEGVVRPGPGIWLLVLGGLALYWAPAIARPLNGPSRGYRDAGHWLADHVPPGQPVVDVTGWSQFYGGRDGFTFANLHEAVEHPENARWVVVRQAHLRGPWYYCDWLRQLVGDRPPVATFPADAQPGDARVLVFDREMTKATAIASDADATKAR